MVSVLIIIILLLIAGIVENIRLKKKINRIKIRILVNGTRGKSSTVRLLVAALNNCGIKTVGKSTGSEANYILDDLSELKIDRRRGTNIVREQKKLFKIASEKNCDAVVCECQAVREENQVLYANKVFCPTLVAITNIRPDHQDVMGVNPEEVILKSVPEGVEALCTDILYSGDVSGFSFKAHPQNIELALLVCDKLGLSRNLAVEGMKKAKGDIGHIDLICVNGKTFINGFAVNDAESAKELFKKKCTVVFANRKDREYRIKTFKKLFEELEIDDIKVIGDNTKKCARIMKGQAFSDFNMLISSCSDTVVCCGNIVGCGRSFLEYLMNHMGENK